MGWGLDNGTPASTNRTPDPNGPRSDPVSVEVWVLWLVICAAVGIPIALIIQALAR